jgi:hypothetical protein
LYCGLALHAIETPPTSWNIEIEIEIRHWYISHFNVFKQSYSESL